MPVSSVTSTTGWPVDLVRWQEVKQNVGVDDRQETRCRNQAVGESLHAIGQLLQPSCLHRRCRVDQFDGSWAALRQAVNLPVSLVVKVVPGERIHEDVAQLCLGGSDPGQVTVLVDGDGLPGRAPDHVPALRYGLTQVPLTIGKLASIA